MCIRERAEEALIRREIRWKFSTCKRVQRTQRREREKKVRVYLHTQNYPWLTERLYFNRVTKFDLPHFSDIFFWTAAAAAAAAAAGVMRL